MNWIQPLLQEGTATARAGRNSETGSQEEGASLCFPPHLPLAPSTGGASQGATSSSLQFSPSVGSLRSHGHQASLSITNSRSLLKLMSIESVMPSSHLILCRPLFLPLIFPSIRAFSNESALRIRWPSTGISASQSINGVCRIPTPASQAEYSCRGRAKR